MQITSFWNVKIAEKRKLDPYSIIIGDGRRMFAGLYYELEMDATFFQRSVYSLLDYLGDVGGLLGFFGLINQGLLYLDVSGNSSEFLVRKLFKKQGRVVFTEE